ncbi:MAG: hypothetical protein Q9165_005153 [Trypethelium subeluteriae]
MSFSKLPNEIILDIVGYLDGQRHIWAMACANRRLYRLLRKYLLRHNIRFRGGDALIWAAGKGYSRIAHTMLGLGAKIDTTGTLSWGATPLYAAAANGNMPMVKMLLKMGADPEAGCLRNRKPLYAAIVSRNEEVVRILFDKMSNVDVFIAGPGPDRTPLHVACIYRLLKSIRYFLERGADVNGSTSQASTPFDLVLHSSVHNSEDPSHGIDLEIILLLLEFGAIPSEDTCRCGLQHPDPRVKGLFQTSGAVRNTGQQVLIGRRWMTSNAELDRKELHGTVCMNWKRFQRAR